MFKSTVYIVTTLALAQQVSISLTLSTWYQYIYITFLYLFAQVAPKGTCSIGTTSIPVDFTPYKGQWGQFNDDQKAQICKTWTESLEQQKEQYAALGVDDQIFSDYMDCVWKHMKTDTEYQIQ